MRRNLAAWIGLVPRQNSSGGKDRLGGISKQSHRYLRQMPARVSSSTHGRCPGDLGMRFSTWQALVADRN